MTLGVEMAERMEVVREITGLPSLADAMRYCMCKGLEGMSSQIHSVRMIKRIESQYSPEEMLPLFKQLEGKKD